jgi:hypothetical protein
MRKDEERQMVRSRRAAGTRVRKKNGTQSERRQQEQREMVNMEGKRSKTAGGCNGEKGGAVLPVW